MTEQVASEGPDVGCGTCEFVGADVVFKRVVSTEINGKPFYAIQGR